jgi:hypothetical protein
MSEESVRIARGSERVAHVTVEPPGSARRSTMGV